MNIVFSRRPIMSEIPSRKRTERVQAVEHTVRWWRRRSPAVMVMPINVTGMASTFQSTAIGFQIGRYHQSTGAGRMTNMKYISQKIG